MAEFYPVAAGPDRPPEARYLLNLMRRYAREALEILGSSSAEDLANDGLRELAVSHATECVGRSAEWVLEPDRRGYPDLDWERLIQDRPALIEKYYAIDLGQVVSKVRLEFPGLIAQLDAILGPEESPQ